MLRSRFIPMILSLLLGGLMPLSFAPVNLAMIAPFALVGLLFLVHGRSAEFPALLRILVGFGMFSWGIWWIRVSLIEFGGAPVIVGVLISFLLAFYLAFYYGSVLFV